MQAGKYLFFVAAMMLSGCYCCCRLMALDEQSEEEVLVQSRDRVRGALLVVAPSEFQSSLQEYLKYKTAIRKTDLVVLETILDTEVGVDAPEKLKRYLYRRWKESGIAYVLLVGDANRIPVRYMVLDRVTEPAFHFSFYPSDLYYADLAKSDGSFDNWNAMNDDYHRDYFGEVRGEKNKDDGINFDKIDYLPDVALGRWPVETSEEVEYIAAKSILFEKSIRQDRIPKNRRAALVSVGGWVDTRPLFTEFSKRLSDRWRVDKSFYSDGKEKNGSEPSHANVCNFFNDGIGLAIHAGHGQPGEWDQCFSVKDLDSISNREQLPIVVSAGCSTAYFATLPPYEPYLDIHGVEHAGTNNGEIFLSPPPPPASMQTGKYNTTGLGEQLLRKSDGGSVAYIGCNTGSQPCGLTLVEGFVDGLTVLPEPTLGDCWSHSIKHYYAVHHLDTIQPNSDWYPPSIFFQGMKFMVFGDPSLPLPGDRSGPSGVENALKAE